MERIAWCREGVLKERKCSLLEKMKELAAEFKPRQGHLYEVHGKVVSGLLFPMISIMPHLGEEIVGRGVLRLMRAKYRMVGGSCEEIVSAIEGEVMKPVNGTGYDEINMEIYRANEGRYLFVRSVMTGNWGQGHGVYWNVTPGYARRHLIAAMVR